MIAMSPQLLLVNRVRRAVRWLLPAALLALAPKCVLCLLTYAGLAGALGLGGPELCGAPGDAAGLWSVWLAILGLAAIGAGFFACSADRRA